MSLDQLEQLASAVQSLVVTIAVIVGGSWTLYTFIRLGTIKKATSELRRLEKELAEQAVVSIEVEPVQIACPPVEGFVVSGVATISNKGNRNAHLDFSAPDCCNVKSVTFDRKGQAMEELIQNVDLELSSYFLRAGAEIRLPFVAAVSEPGLYAVQVRCPLSEPEARQAAEAARGQSETLDFSWSGKGYVAVE